MFFFRQIGLSYCVQLLLKHLISGQSNTSNETSLPPSTLANPPPNPPPSASGGTGKREAVLPSHSEHGKFASGSYELAKRNHKTGDKYYGSLYRNNQIDENRNAPEEYIPFTIEKYVSRKVNAIKCAYKWAQSDMTSGLNGTGGVDYSYGNLKPGRFSDSLRKDKKSDSTLPQFDWIIAALSPIGSIYSLMKFHV